MEVSDSGVSVVSRPYGRCSGDQIEIHILAVVGLTRGCQLIAKAKVQRQIVFDAPVVLGEYPKETVAQVLVSTAAVALLNILRKAEQEIGNTIAGGSAIVAGELAIEDKLPGQTGIAGIQVIHDVVIGLETAVNHMPAVGPGSGIFKLPCGVMKGLDQVAVADRPHIRSGKGHLRQETHRQRLQCRTLPQGSVLWGWRIPPSLENTGIPGERR